MPLSETSSPIALLTGTVKELGQALLPAATVSDYAERLHCSSMWSAPGVSASASLAWDIVALETARAINVSMSQMWVHPLCALLLQTTLCCRRGTGQSRRKRQACQEHGLAQHLLTCLWHRRWGDGQSNQYGDIHFYSYDKDNFDPATYPKPRFVSEFGYESLPSWFVYQDVTQQEDWSRDSNMTEFRSATVALHQPGFRCCQGKPCGMCCLATDAAASSVNQQQKGLTGSLT